MKERVVTVVHTIVYVCAFATLMLDLLVWRPN